MYQVNEMFNSVQGEGFWSGVPATFIRLQGCTVGCDWCDTKYTWKKGGQKMSVGKIMEQVRWKHVVITGGEPTLWNLDPLLEALHTKHLYTQLETSGQNELKGTMLPSWVTWSPKKNLDYECAPGLENCINEVKFVVDERLGIGTVTTILENEGYNRYVTFMPEGCPPVEDHIKKALAFTEAFANNHLVRVSDRLQWRFNLK